MPRRRHYTLTDPAGVEHDLSCESVLPDGPLGPGWALYYRHTKKPGVRNSVPPYTPNNFWSVYAWWLAQPHRDIVITRVLQELVTNTGKLLWGRDLIRDHGTDALRRVRELERDYGYPIEKEPPPGKKRGGGPGTWYYGLPLPPRPNVIVMKRRPRH